MLLSKRGNMQDDPDQSYPDAQQGKNDAPAGAVGDVDAGQRENQPSAQTAAPTSFIPSGPGFSAVFPSSGLIPINPNKLPTRTIAPSANNALPDPLSK